MAFSFLTLCALALGGCGSSSGSMNQAITCRTTAAYPPAPYGTDTGSTIKDITLRVRTGANGTPAAKKLSDYRAQCVAGNLKVLAVAGAAEWCAPCMQEQPALVADSGKYASKGVQFLVAVIQKNNMMPADDATVTAWGTRFSIPFDLASDPDSVLGDYFDLQTFPTTMVIRLDDMTIQGKQNGYMPGWIDGAIDQALQ